MSIVGCQLRPPLSERGIPPTWMLASRTLSSVHASDRVSGAPPHGVYQLSRPAVVSKLSIRVSPVGPTAREVRAFGADQESAGRVDCAQQIGCAGQLGPSPAAVPEHTPVGTERRVAEHAGRAGDRHAAGWFDESLDRADPQRAHDERNPASVSAHADGSARYGALNAIRSTRSP